MSKPRGTGNVRAARVAGRRVVYVHPFGHPEDDVVPFGLVGLMNALEAPKLGLFAHELTRRVAERAAVLLMDVHWLHGLAPARSISRAVRRIDPGIPIVVGGYTASVLAEELVADHVADYVVVGDAEGALGALVELLLAGEDAADVPNVVSRAGRARRSYVLSTADFDAGDYRSLDWFPSLQARQRLRHASEAGDTKHPALLTYKGCRPPARRPTAYCAGCYGQPAAQERLMGRTLVARSARRVRADLAAYSADPFVRKVYLLDDCITVLGEDYAREVFAERYDLALHMEPYEFFSPGLLRQLAGCFTDVTLEFYHDDLAAALVERDRAALAFLGAARELQVKVGICTVTTPAPALRELAQEYGFEVFDNECEALALPPPGIAGAARAAEYQRVLTYSRHFAVFKLIASLAPTFLDAIAVQLGSASVPAGWLESVLATGVRDAACRLAPNPVHRQLMSGANPLNLTFWAAPAVFGAQRPSSSFCRCGRDALLATPMRVEHAEMEIGDVRSRLRVELPFVAARAGVPDAVAINVVSERPGAMADLPYEQLWKLWLPLHSSHPVQPGQELTVRGHVDYGLDPPVRVWLDAG